MHSLKGSMTHGQGIGCHFFCGETEAQRLCLDFMASDISVLAGFISGLLSWAVIYAPQRVGLGIMAPTSKVPASAFVTWWLEKDCEKLLFYKISPCSPMAWHCISYSNTFTPGWAVTGEEDPRGSSNHSCSRPKRASSWLSNRCSSGAISNFSVRVLTLDHCLIHEIAKQTPFFAVWCRSFIFLLLFFHPSPFLSVCLSNGFKEL